MMRAVEVFGGVLVLGRIAAADVTASEADPQVNPLIAGFHAIFTNVAGGLEVAGFLKMSAGLHVRSMHRSAKKPQKSALSGPLESASSQLAQLSLCPINRARPFSVVTQGLSVQGGL